MLTWSVHFESVNNNLVAKAIRKLHCVNVCLAVDSHSNSEFRVQTHTVTTKIPVVKHISQK